MICKKCKAIIDDKAAICVHCGAKTKNYNKAIGKKPFYARWWFWVLVVLASLYIIGSLPPSEEELLAQENVVEPSSQSTVPVEETKQEETQKEEVVQKETQAPPPKTEKEVFCDDFCASSGFDLTVGEDLYDFFTSELSANKIVFVEKFEGSLYSYVISADGFSINVTLDEDKIYGASCGTYLMYNEGTVYYTVPDLSARSIQEFESQYYVIAMDIIKNCLKVPDSAEFCPIYECNMQRNGELAAVQGYVTAMNSFGALLKNEFTVQFYLRDPEKWVYETTYVNLSGETTGEFIPFE